MVRASLGPTVEYPVGRTDLKEGEFREGRTVVIGQRPRVSLAD